MTGTLTRGFGYQGDQMNLPVPDLEAALPFYQRVLGFAVESRSDVPHKAAALVRDGVRIGLAENGGDPSQDGCAFHVEGLDVLLMEFRGRGLEKELTDVKVEEHDGDQWRIFYVVAPDGLCFWFGERQAG